MFKCGKWVNNLIMKRIVFFLLFVILLFIETVAHAQYGLLLSSFRDKEKAVTYAETLGVIKKNVFIEKSEMVGSGTWYRVCLGPFDSRGEALTYRNSRSDDIGSEKYALVVDINKQAIVPFDETSQKLITNVRQELTFDAEKNEGDRADIAGENTTTISSSGNDDQDQNEEELPEEFFGILYASFRTEELARQEAERIHKKFKDDAYVEQVTMRTSGQWFRVCIGPYMERQKAGQVRERLIKEKEIKSQNTVVTTALSRLVFRAKDESEHENMGAEAKSVEVSGNGKNDQVTKADGDDSEERKVVITWDRVSGKDVTGYKLYYGTVPGPPYEPPKEDYIAEGPPPIRVGNDMTQKELHGLNPDKNYYFAITAVDGDGNESDYSSEIVLESGHVKKVVPHEKQSDERFVSTKVATNKSPMVTKRPPDRTYRRYPVRKRYPIVKKDDSRVEKSREASHTGTIAPGDIVFISIPGQKEMTRRYDVDPDGNIYLLIVGKLPVGEKSEAEATKLLEQVAQTLVTEKDKTIDLRIVERKRYVNIAGGVRYPGWYRMDNETTLDEIVRMAGGMIPGSDKNKGTLLRRVGNEYKEVKLDRTITLSPNDIIEFAMPRDYQETADAGDTLFISIPQRQAPGRMMDRVDSADLTGEIEQNKIDVDINGFIHLPSYGHIYVNGLTADEIKEEITRRLPRYIAELKRVEVGIVEKKHHIQVMGHVEEPGEYVVPESANIQQAVSLAGGITDGAVMSDCVIQRSTDGQRKHLKVNLYQYTITGDIRPVSYTHLTLPTN